MKHRIRSAGFIVQDEKILLVKHCSPDARDDFWWVPPGGGVEASDDSIFACAAREIFEETGLTATLSRIAYVREFYDGKFDVRHCEFFLPVDSFSGTPSLDFLPPSSPDSDLVTELRWFTQSELAEITLYPEELRDIFWADLAEGFPSVRYLGLQKR